MRVFIGCIAMGIFFASAWAQNPSVETKLSRDTMEIGEQIEYSVSVRHRPQESIVGDPLVDFNDFEIVQIRKYEPAKAGSDVVEQWQYTITTFRLDTFDIPPPRVALTDGSDTSIVEGISKRLIVVSVLDTSIKDIQPEKPLFAGEINWWLLVLYLILIVAAVTGLIYLLYRLWQRRKQRQFAAPVVPIVIRRPEEIALEELEKIKARRLVDKGEYKLFHTEVSNVVRTYIENKFHMQALEMPTSELMRHFQQYDKLDSTHVSILRALLEVADLVKFAKYKPSPAECSDVMERAEKFVVSTSPPISQTTTVAS